MGGFHSTTATKGVDKYGQRAQLALRINFTSTRRPTRSAYVFPEERPRGDGIGLASASAIVRKHGRDIDVTSELGRGTEMRIRLPSNT